MVFHKQASGSMVEENKHTEEGRRANMAEP